MGNEMLINPTTDIRPIDDIKAITRIGLLLPAELYIMITDGCNLTCRHCWPRAKDVAASTSINPSDLQALLENFIRLSINTLTPSGSVRIPVGTVSPGSNVSGAIPSIVWQISPPSNGSTAGITPWKHAHAVCNGCGRSLPMQYAARGTLAHRRHF